MSKESIERDTLEVDILCVGAGVASLTTALRLLRHCDEKKAAVHRLSPGGSRRVPWVPPEMRSHGMPILSLSRVVKWMGELVEAAGAEIYTDMPGSELLFDGDRVAGVRIRDRGWNKHGERRKQFEPGADIRAKVVVLGEGAAGYLTDKLAASKHLAEGRNPQACAIGIKEIFDVPAAPDRVGHVIHYVRLSPRLANLRRRLCLPA
jgi:electron-transferring-flavoprotein dehydrogenase